jgi:uncharacterized protein (DUF111 family)
MEVQEVFLTSILMKKNRPAILLTVISPSEKLSSVIEFLIKETTTLGLRWHEEDRACTQREVATLQTKHGKIRFKLARWGDKPINFAPEYEDCKKLALMKKVSLKEVFDEAKKEATVFLSRLRSTH